MKKKKVYLCLALLIIIVVVIAVFLASPYLRMEKIIKDLINSDYEYTLEYEISGLDITNVPSELKGKIEGKKSDDIVKGNIYVEDSKYLELYAQRGGEYLFNIKPAIKKIIDNVKTDLPFSLGIFSQTVPDTYISLDRINEIAGGDDFKELDGVELFTDLSKEHSYHIQRVDAPIGQDTVSRNYFQIIFEDVDADIIVGLPKLDDEVYMKISHNEVKLEFNISYQKKPLDDMEMPKENIKESSVELLKQIYAIWKIKED